jgi:hypothetical protein
LDFTEIGFLHKGGGDWDKKQRDREAGEKTKLLTEGEEEPGEVAGRSPEMVAAGGDRRRGGGESPGETENRGSRQGKQRR